VSWFCLARFIHDSKLKLTLLNQFRITMAAIDPTDSAAIDQPSGGAVPRATLKLIRQSIESNEDDSEDDEDDDDYMRALLAGSEPDSDDSGEETNGGPSDPTKSKKAQKQAALMELLQSVDKGSDDEMEDVPNGANGVKADKKGKAKASSDEQGDEDISDSDEEDLEVEEFVICTLDPEKVSASFSQTVFQLIIPFKTYQQPLDITISEGERVFFKVSGTHTIHLTGNYVIPDGNGHNIHDEMYDSNDEEVDEDYDLSPDEDELELELDNESDKLDNLENPRITEVESEDEAPALVTKTEKKGFEKKGKNKRSAQEIEEGDTLDDLVAKSSKLTEAATNGEPKLSKKQLKKLKKNSGEAVTTKAEEAKKGATAKENLSNKGDKKVQFAKNLEQGPTGSVGDNKGADKDTDKSKPKADVKENKGKAELDTDKSKPKADVKENKGKAELGVKTINGVKVDDKKLGTGPVAKKGNHVGMRYIGKLTDGKVFDCKCDVRTKSL
jgi:FK506-binding nuclear protein